MLCDLDMIVIFGKYHCLVLMESEKSLVFEGYQRGDLYMVDFSAGPQLAVCLLAKASECWLWHRRLGHAGMRNLYTLEEEEACRGHQRRQVQERSSVWCLRSWKDDKGQASLEDNHDYISTLRAASHGLIWPYSLLYSYYHCLPLWRRYC